MKNQHLRKIASNKILLPDGQVLSQSVVEIVSGRVEKVYSLTSEQAQTEWWSGWIQLRYDAEGHLLAFYGGKQIE